jgi:hypothetical protein
VNVQAGDIPAVYAKSTVSLSAWDGPQTNKNVGIFEGQTTPKFSTRNSDSPKFHIAAADIKGKVDSTPLIRFNVMRRHRFSAAHQYSAIGNYIVILSAKYRDANKNLVDVNNARKLQDIACSKLERAGELGEY